MTTPPRGPADPQSSGQVPGPTLPDNHVRNRNIILAVILLIVGIGAGVLVAFLVSNDSSSSKNKTTTSSSTSSSSTSSSSTSSSSTTSSTTTSTTTTVAAPQIGTFTVPTTVACPSNQPVPITISWSTTGATSVALSIDGPGIYGTYGPNASTTVNFPCDGASHLYRLAARADGQPDAVQSKTVNPAP